MVPGMTERERLAADVRRLAWLAEAAIGPTRIGRDAGPRLARGELRPSLPIGLWRRGLSSARVLGQRVRLLHPTPGRPLPNTASTPVR